MRFRPSPATLIALVALFVALGGPAAAQKQMSKIINGNKIKPNTITSRQVRAGSLSRTDLNAASIRFLQRTPDRAIRSNQLATGAVTSDKLAPASVGTVQVADQTILGDDLAPNAITSGALAADSVGFDEIADSAVGKASLRAASVGKSELGDAAVGLEELALSGAAAVTFTELAAGACGAVDSVVTLPANSSPLTSRFILVGQPTSWPGDTVTLAARAKDSTTLRLTACNLGDAAVNPGAQTIAFAALAP